MPEESLWALISRTVEQSGGIEKSVFFLLLFLSLASWCVMLYKFWDFSRARANNRKFLNVFEDADNLGTASTASKSLEISTIGSIFQAGMQVLESTPPTPAYGGPPPASDPRKISMRPLTSKDEWLRAGLEHASVFQIQKLRKGLSFLATLGSTAPFIGLFGTVWGIMATFRALGATSSTSLSVVAPGISASLIATAAGLAVAIPAVVGYNWFLGLLEQFQESHDQFCENFFLLVKSSGYWIADSAPMYAAPVQSHAPLHHPRQAPPPPPLPAYANSGNLPGSAPQTAYPPAGGVQ